MVQRTRLASMEHYRCCERLPASVNQNAGQSRYLPSASQQGTNGLLFYEGQRCQRHSRYRTTVERNMARETVRLLLPGSALRPAIQKRDPFLADLLLILRSCGLHRMSWGNGHD